MKTLCYSTFPDNLSGWGKLERHLIEAKSLRSKVDKNNAQNTEENSSIFDYQVSQGEHDLLPMEPLSQSQADESQAQTNSYKPGF